ncbi:MAG: DUF1002 domain-containing protein [Lactobacillus sp.]|uniref:DUF1002 domain-containing protein n=1 Tax=Bombilactobacillus bombi TaxID=1303590 RepID=A0A347STV1_9LACO|nr:DUF1002 domain-containing protein [Bombilactobacillus bombi]MCO6540776.1 DUF1002 domain-containing protein [Lactobacillus sp.]AXX65460.1 DUF1002 domain-containing protein [Bombilactobacillus bombi]MCO6542422.1 DUF1002 domain-containing protein [Lactobacillus sp.]RHW48652.1 DUF1002 domain-containing protein [Bombilactobacillus bombi]RHW52138.1 DUF1002 domain-containing protein [Bombilactobacillus bombi]
MKKLLGILTAMLLAFIGVFGLESTVKADNWDTPIMTLGSSLTPEQHQGTVDVLSEKIHNNNSQQITVNGDTLVKYLNPAGDNFTSNSGVWSSALIEKTGHGSGINVEIVPYNGKNNITTITANQYRNAALTAGVTDANIYVTSATPIDGSGALAGVYAAFSQNGNSLNQDQVTAAQNEMGTLSKITQQNEGQKGYSDAQLNNAVAQAKNEMAKVGPNITVNQITNIVNNTIKDNNLQNVLSDNQKQQIINILIQVRNSGALKNGDFKNQAGKLSDTIKSKAQGIFNKINTPQNQNFFQQLWTSIVNFFSNLFH